jgi:hypothetical protein
LLIDLGLPKSWFWLSKNSPWFSIQAWFEWWATIGPLHFETALSSYLNKKSQI